MIEASRWFVLTTHWRQEKLALDNLRRQGFDAYLPMQQTLIRPRGQPERIVPLPFFPRYVFTKVDMGAPGWTAIYSTRGVVGVLPTGEAGTRVLGRLVADLRTREEAGFLKLLPGQLPCRWAAGDRVTYGAFVDALFVERVDERRCRILVSLLGVDSQQVVDLTEIKDSGGT
jgi:transcriptional antiterminator RfaH